MRAKAGVPGDRGEFVGDGVVGERVGETAFVFQLVVGPGEELGDRVACEEFRRDAFFGGFPGDGFGAVFAELEGGGVLLVRPGAAGAVEAGGFVGAVEEKGGDGHVHLLADGFGGGFQGAPAAGGGVVGFDAGEVVVGGHGGFLWGRNRWFSWP